MCKNRDNQIRALHTRQTIFVRVIKLNGANPYGGNSNVIW